MILRRPLLAFPSTAISISKPSIRHLQHSIPTPPIPKPIPFIPDHASFLTAIGRNLSAHTPKIPSWDALFTLTSTQLKDLGVEPARSRRYLLHWLDKFRAGDYGVGGDCQHVTDGVAHLRLVEAPVKESDVTQRRSRIATGTRVPGTRKVVVNVPAGEEGVAGGDVRGVRGFVVKGAKTIQGPYVEYVKGSGGVRARLRLQEGVWEVKRGHKVDGGERRRAEVRAKRRAAENREEREKQR
ncbi:hypothetical protein EJ04DRAFT_553182 [Polyplosphaeria fusca]|uniref:Small ribosomal subunit protein mS41 n=1 Tax=Polyplosphaeria fusca TaxID=682080 RepID=A0A9P4QYW7_9PLEO|nr:hypothetical protein EJ04DRAFT_553182 [Polyplosphaeria fusca]